MVANALIKTAPDLALTPWVEGQERTSDADGLVSLRIDKEGTCDGVLGELVERGGTRGRSV